MNRGSEDERIVKGYLYLGTPQQQIEFVDRTQGSLTTVAPPYFELVDGGQVQVNIDPEFVRAMHDRGILVTPTLTNHWNRQNAVDFLAEYRDNAMLMADLVQGNGLDGLDVDIENVTHDQREQYSNFVKMLKQMMPDQLVSVAVAANPSGWNTGWHGSYDYARLANNADSIYLMAYDQSYEGGLPGPVASLEWVEDSIRYALRNVPSDKLVLGVPFFGRLWDAAGGIRGKSISLNYAQSLIDTYGGTITFDEDAQVPYATFTIAEGDPERTLEGKALPPGDYQLWFEDDRSLREKLALVEQYDLAGAGVWSLGQEDPAVWNHFVHWMNGEAESAPPVEPPAPPEPAPMPTPRPPRPPVEPPPPMPTPRPPRPPVDPPPPMPTPRPPRPPVDPPPPMPTPRPPRPPVDPPPPMPTPRPPRPPADRPCFSDPPAEIPPFEPTPPPEGRLFQEWGISSAQEIQPPPEPEPELYPEPGPTPEGRLFQEWGISSAQETQPPPELEPELYPEPEPEPAPAPVSRPPAPLCPYCSMPLEGFVPPEGTVNPAMPPAQRALGESSLMEKPLPPVQRTSGESRLTEEPLPPAQRTPGESSLAEEPPPPVRRTPGESSLVEEPLPPVQRIPGETSLVEELPPPARRSSSFGPPIPTTEPALLEEEEPTSSGEGENSAGPRPGTQAPPAMPSIGEVGRGRVVDANYLNVRTGPSASYQVITRLRGGTQVRILGERDGWYEIVLPGGRVGYVSGEYVQVDQPVIIS